MSVETDVRTFMTRMGQLEPVDNDDLPRLREFRIALIDEEYDELVQAIQWGDEKFIAKECADLVYVVVGTCAALGIPFDLVWDAVHSANMSKLDDQGNPYLDSRGKVLKGPNYQAPEPKIERLLKKG